MAMTVGGKAKPIVLMIGVIVVLLTLLYVGASQRRSQPVPAATPPLHQPQ